MLLSSYSQGLYVISDFNQKETMGIESVVAMLSELKMKNQVLGK